MSVEQDDGEDADRENELTANDADAEAAPSETEFAGPAELRCGIALGSEDE